MQTKQVTNHNKDNGLLNMIKRTAPMIYGVLLVATLCKSGIAELIDKAVEFGF